MMADELYLDLISQLETRQVEPAQETLQRLRGLEPLSQRVVVAEARLLELTGQPDQACERLEQYVSKNLDSGVARANLARLYYKSGERSKAVSTVRFALMRAPNQERSLHFYASLIQEDGGIQGALDTLKLLSDMPGAWLPAWVAAQLARAHHQPERIAEFLLQAARNSQVPFPPNPESFRELFMSVPTEVRRALASDLRSYCREEVRGFLDLVLSATAPRYLAPGSAPRVYALRRSVWRHLVAPTESSTFGLGAVTLIKPESWGVAEIAGKLGRGYALLVSEGLDARVGVNAAVFLETDPERGLITRSDPLPAGLLAGFADSSCTHLVSSYLSYREPSEFLLDLELYDHQGEYSGRESFRGAHPGECFAAMSQRLSTFAQSLSATPPKTGGFVPPHPDFTLSDALAREAVSVLTLCSQGALNPEAIANPGQLLDQLVEYALSAASGAAMLTLWAGVEAAARAKLQAGLLQRPIIEELFTQNEELRRWIAP